MSPFKGAGTFFGCETLNRVSFLREEIDFVNSSLTHGSTTFIPFVRGEALLLNGSLYSVKLEESPWIGPIVRKLLPIINTKTSGLRCSGVNFTFLGLKEGKELHEGEFIYRSRYRGTPYYGLDFHVNSDTLIKIQDITPLIKMPRVDREILFTMDNESASIYSQAKMYLDWLSKYRFCPGCGSPMYSINAGTKLQCSNASNNSSCEVRDATITNVCFPRTDPVVIVAITSRDFSKICLVRSRHRFGDTIMYTTIAGFMEPSETVENACRREIWEETGIHCHEITMITTQPWPYPANLMIGCLGVVDANGINEIISLDHDQELIDAQWFSSREVGKALDGYDGRGMVRFKDSIRLPGSTAVAFHLIKYVCDKYRGCHA